MNHNVERDQRKQKMSHLTKVFIVKEAYQADHKVFIVDHHQQEKNAQLISRGVLVDHAYKADVKIFVVKHEYQASIRITHQNFPR